MPAQHIKGLMGCRPRARRAMSARRGAVGPAPEIALVSADDCGRSGESGFALVAAPVASLLAITVLLPSRSPAATKAPSAP